MAGLRFWQPWGTLRRMSITRRAVLGASLIPFVGTGNSPDTGDLIALRRDLHAHPELAGQEVYTSGVVAQRLRAAGLEVTTGVGGHGVVGVLHGARRGRTVAYRADMDAVPPQGQINGGPDPAHVCGHDIHTTVGIGVAEALSRRRRALKGTFVFVFQPGEEALTGATSMLADHVLDRIRPAEIHALHCMALPVGTCAVMPGYGLPGQDHATITAVDPDAAQSLAAAVNALGTVAPLRSPAQIEQLVADLQTQDGPLAEFVYMNASAAGSQVRVSYRCWPESRYTAVRQELQRLAGPAPVTYPGEPFPAVVNDDRLARAEGRQLPRTVMRLHASVPFNGDDFAVFLRQIPGTYSFLGVRRPGASIETSYPHFGGFDPDERAIAHGVRAMSGWLAHRGSASPSE